LRKFLDYQISAGKFLGLKLTLSKTNSVCLSVCLFMFVRRLSLLQIAVMETGNALRCRWRQWSW